MTAPLTSKTSLTERLRHAEKFESDFDAVDDLLLAAADEIDRLTALLEQPPEATGACNCGDRWVHATDCPAAPRREPEDRV